MFAFVSAFNKKEATKISRGQAGSLDDPDPRPARAVVSLCLLLDENAGYSQRLQPVLLHSQASAQNPPNLHDSVSQIGSDTNSKLDHTVHKECCPGQILPNLVDRRH